MSRLLPHIEPTGSPVSAEYQLLMAEQAAAQAAPAHVPTPADESDRSANPLRPRRLADLVGQLPARELVSAALRRSRRHAEPLPHMLLVGPAGTGKSTIAHIAATEMGTHVYQLAAPVSYETLIALREVMRDGDILFIDELHLQAVQERRGRESITRPEVLFGLMEDRVIATPSGVLPFPAITVMGATTDEGMLSDAFLSRFPLRPRMIDYTEADLAEIARRNAKVLGGRVVGEQAARIIAVCSRGVPREVNNLVRTALLYERAITVRSVRKVLAALRIEESDGLTADMAQLLTFLYMCARQRLQSGEIRYQASVSTIATGIGKSRDTKSIVLRIEPYLIRRGYLQITHGGRRLTERGAERAKQLVGELPPPATERPVSQADRTMAAVRRAMAA